MIEENGIAAVASSPGDEFAHAYANYARARDEYGSAKAKVDEAQVEQTEAIAALSDDQRADMAQLEAVADRIGIKEVGGAAFQRLCAAHEAFDDMMRIEAPTAFALFLKLQALGEVPWTDPFAEAGHHLARLTADAGMVSLQFATVWLERWRKRGGSAVLDPHQGNRLSTFAPCFSISPDAAALEERQNAAGLPLEDHQRSWHAAFHDGQMRELSDLLDEVPGLRYDLRVMLAADPGVGEPTAEAIAAAQREGA